MARISANRIDMEGARIDQPVFKNNGETVVGGAAGTNGGTAYAVNIATGNVFNLILNAGTCTLSFTNPKASGTACKFTLYLKQDASGSRGVIWPGTVKWAGASTPTLTTAPNRFDVFRFITLDGGASYFGLKGGLNFS